MHGRWIWRLDLIRGIGKAVGPCFSRPMTPQQTGILLILSITVGMFFWGEMAA